MFFHILLWNLYPDADPTDVAEGMRRMQRENPAEMKRLTFGRRAEVVSAGPLPFGELRRGRDGLEPTGEGFEYFFLMDFEDNPAYRRYVDSDAHMDFVWESCAARWSRFMSINQVHEEELPTAAAPWPPRSAQGRDSELVENAKLAYRPRADYSRARGN